MPYGCALCIFFTAFNLTSTRFFWDRLPSSRDLDNETPPVLGTRFVKVSNGNRNHQVQMVVS